MKKVVALILLVVCGYFVAPSIANADLGRRVVIVHRRFIAPRGVVYVGSPRVVVYPAWHHHWHRRWYRGRWRW